MSIETRSRLMTVGFGVTLAYGMAVSVLLVRTRQDLAAYQRGALSILAQKIEEHNSAGQLQRMEELGLIDALNDPHAARGGR
ncbi:MAG TPA: hypothetical protein VNI01_01755 [Elusimicrobiota bacterium]|jgi:hypothetical protein|nr:hypothetical protein [Elusimicrobiota bacterium]